jgi:hypothetical protein
MIQSSVCMCGLKGVETAVRPPYAVMCSNDVYSLQPALHVYEREYCTRGLPALHVCVVCVLQYSAMHPFVLTQGL